MSEQSLPFAGRRWLIEAATVGQGRLGEVIATAAECDSAARALDIIGCSGLVLKFDLRPLPGSRFQLKCHLRCDVVQASIVSLEPVAARIDERSDTELIPEGGSLPDTGEGPVDVLNAPVIETYAEGRIDLGLLAFELLAISLDPYPRLEGEALPEAGAGDLAVPSPFAALASLHKPKS